MNISTYELLVKVIPVYDSICTLYAFFHDGNTQQLTQLPLFRLPLIEPQHNLPTSMLKYLLKVIVYRETDTDSICENTSKSTVTASALTLSKYCHHNLHQMIFTFR